MWSVNFPSSRFVYLTSYPSSMERKNVFGMFSETKDSWRVDSVVLLFTSWQSKTLGDVAWWHHLKQPKYLSKILLLQKVVAINSLLYLCKIDLAPSPPNLILVSTTQSFQQGTAIQSCCSKNSTRMTTRASHTLTWATTCIQTQGRKLVVSDYFGSLQPHELSHKSSYMMHTHSLYLEALKSTVWKKCVAL